MKAKDIMNCFFDECLLSDSIDTVRKQMLEKQSDYILAVDKHGKYKGMVYSHSILRLNNASHICADVYEETPPITEDVHLKAVQMMHKSVIPVVNKDDFPVGVIGLEEIFGLWQSEQKENNYQKKMPSNKSAKYTIDDIVGNTPAIMGLKERIISAAKVKSTVLIMGETGVGKELVAQAIANLSARRFKPFVRINCAAIPESLLESELFGYEAGAYTGAQKGGNLGKFEIADGGTILLDEIGDMQLIMQAKILRVLQEREIEKIGGRFPIPVDVRIIAATHADLERMMNEHTFREDLYYRLNVIPIHIPPLREHVEDLEDLFLNFMDKCALEMEIPTPKVEPGVFEMLSHYHWPGNIRELKNLVEMLAASSNGRITKGMLSAYFTDKMDLSDSNENYLKLSAFESERELILKHLKIHDNNKNKVADVLGISRSTLYNKLKRYHIR